MRRLLNREVSSFFISIYWCPVNASNSVNIKMFEWYKPHSLDDSPEPTVADRRVKQTSIAPGRCPGLMALSPFRGIIQAVGLYHSNIFIFTELEAFTGHQYF